MTDSEHYELAYVLTRAKGKVVLSGYRCDFMDTLYKSWNCIEAPEKMCHSVKKSRKEAIWVNF
jgi:DNA adenine methylase